MTQFDIDLIKTISIGMAVCIVGSSDHGIRLSLNEKEVYIANTLPWVDIIEMKDRVVEVDFDIGQMMLRPPLYELICSAIMSPIFNQEAEKMLKEQAKLKKYQFVFSYHY